MSTRPLPCSVVLGGGLGGICAAAALRHVSDEVVVVERDGLPSEPAGRRGVPQSEQLHNLLTCAQIHLERLLPGFGAEMRDAGCGDASVADETHVFELGIRMPERNLGLRLMCAWRPVIEHVARSLLLRAGRVVLRERTQATGLVLAPDGSVAGAALRVAGTPEVLEASLVVDATGAGSLAPWWLRALGRAAPPVETVRSEQWYVTALLERPKQWVDDPAFWLTFATPPRSPAGLVSPVRRDRWYVSLSGRRPDPPPRSHAEMAAYAARLEDPSIAELVAASTPLGPPHVFHKITTAWRRYDRLDDPIFGFLPLGDAVAAFNPLYGQGISVASWQAAELAEILQECDGGRADPEMLTVEYLARSTRACEAAWSLGELVDRAVTSPSPAMPHDDARYRALAHLIKGDTALHRLYVGVWHLIEPASALTQPLFASRLDEAATSLRAGLLP